MNEYQIIGPPGTGKTTTLAKQIKHSCDEYGWNRVLVTSLTRAAAHEVASRTDEIDRQNIGTLHAICFRLLGQPDLAEKFVNAWNKENPGLEREGLPDVDETSVEASDVWGRIDLYRHQMISLDIWPMDSREIYLKWKRWKEENDFLDFTDLIEKCLELDPPDVDVVIGDEAQDYSKLELALLRHWGKDVEKFILAGDPDQVLYHWRGADVNLFKGTYTQRKVLSQSYRVPFAVHRHAQDWVRNIQDREDFLYEPTPETGFVTKMNKSLRSFDVREIEDHDGTVMILATCGYMLQNTVAMLKKFGIPFWNPYKRKQGNWNPIRETTVERLQFWLKEEKLAKELEKAIEHIDSKHLLRGIKSQIKEIDKEAVFSDFELFKVFSESGLELLDRGLDGYFDGLLLSKRKNYEYLKAVIERHGFSALLQPPKVIVGTVHSVKGGEADYVYLFPEISPKAEEQRYTDTGNNALIRTFYVGMTRAKKGLFLGSGNGRCNMWY